MTDPKSLSHREKIEQLTACVFEALDRFGKHMDPADLEELAGDLIDRLPATFLARAAADRIEELATAAVFFGVHADMNTARDVVGQTFCDEVANALDTLITQRSSTPEGSPVASDPECQGCDQYEQCYGHKEAQA